jgi:hypothetical protein
MRQFPTIHSLSVIRAYLQRHQFGQVIPDWIETSRYPLDMATREQPWELDLFAKEIVLNASERGSLSFARWKDFSTALNMLRALENEIYGVTPEADRRVLFEIFRIAHRQFPWQSRPNSRGLVRHYKIFSHAELNAILRDQIGLDAQQLYTIGMALIGHYITRFEMRLPAQVKIPLLTPEMFSQFVQHFSTDLSALKAATGTSQRYDADYAYGYNPMRRWPLLRYEENGSEFFLAPIPTHLFRKFTEGIYYDICSAPGFSQAFGDAFQSYVGEVFQAVKADRLTIVPEQPYRVGRDDKRSVDWIVQDGSADLFVECKTKRLRLESKINFAVTNELDDDLDKMADAVLQVYKTIVDALANRYEHWSWREKPLFPLIVTLEEWYFLSPDIISNLSARVQNKFAESDLDLALLERYPYTICGIDDFEFAIQIMVQVGIEPFMREKCLSEYRTWNLHGFMSSKFSANLGNVRHSLFDDVFGEIHSALQ